MRFESTDDFGGPELEYSAVIHYCSGNSFSEIKFENEVARREML